MPEGNLTGRMPEKRRRKRTKMVLPLRVWVDGSNGAGAEFQFAHTLDITQEGARLGGLRSQLKPGQVITLQRGRHKMQFRIKWTKQLPSKELQAGIESLEPEKNIWGLDISDEKQAADKYQEFLLKILTKK
jgi:hypothetical protein